MKKAYISKHNYEVQRNLVAWKNKPILRKIYRYFHLLISEHLLEKSQGYSVELGSGIGNIKEVIPHCIRTDLFPNPWIDRVENAYKLSFSDKTVSNFILFDVFHHLRYPGSVLNELFRVLIPKGRVLIFEPCLSMLGLIVYGLFHEEELGLRKKIQMFAPKEWYSEKNNYYTAQANAFRIFVGRKYQSLLKEWRVISKKRISAISYITSGGYSKPQLYPDKAYPLMKVIDRVCDLVPLLFATRMLIVLEKDVAAEKANAPERC